MQGWAILAIVNLLVKVFRKCAFMQALVTASISCAQARWFMCCFAVAANPLKGETLQRPRNWRVNLKRMQNEKAKKCQGDLFDI